MRKLDIAQTQSTPLIRFDPKTSVLTISGESYPENSFEFYAPINVWLKEQLVLQSRLQLDINISYMNSSSTKCILDLLDLLEDVHLKGGAIAIVWRYDSDNPRSLDLAEEFKEEVSFPFSIITLDK
jgi:hypothetical protein